MNEAAANAIWFFFIQQRWLRRILAPINTYVYGYITILYPGLSTTMNFSVFGSSLIAESVFSCLLLEDIQAVWRCNSDLRELVDNHVSMITKILHGRGSFSKLPANIATMGNIYQHAIREGSLLCVGHNAPKRLQDAVHVVYCSTQVSSRSKKRPFSVSINASLKHENTVAVINTTHPDPKRRRMLFTNMGVQLMDLDMHVIRWHS